MHLWCLQTALLYVTVNLVKLPVNHMVVMILLHVVSRMVSEIVTVRMGSLEMDVKNAPGVGCHIALSIATEIET